MNAQKIPIRTIGVSDKPSTLPSDIYYHHIVPNLSILERYTQWAVSKQSQHRVTLREFVTELGLMSATLKHNGIEYNVKVSLSVQDISNYQVFQWHVHPTSKQFLQTLSDLEHYFITVSTPYGIWDFELGKNLSLPLPTNTFQVALSFWSHYYYNVPNIDTMLTNLGLTPSLWNFSTVVVIHLENLLEPSETREQYIEKLNQRSTNTVVRKLYSKTTTMPIVHPSILPYLLNLGVAIQDDIYMYTYHQFLLAIEPKTLHSL
jgi:hypothetical protein